MDENLHPDMAEFFRRHGHDAVTVWDEELRGRSDDLILARCQAEGRALVSFDLGFADIRYYPPQQYCGLIVLRLENQAREQLIDIAPMILDLLASEPLAGHLWIVNESSVRVRGR
jgi:predicted nuclease of predicted toxin-antitoxin system